MQIVVNTHDPFHLVYQGNEGAIVNMDLTNSILVGPDEGDLFPQSPNTFIIGPLNFAAVDGTQDYWAIAVAGTPAVQFMPGVTVWAPSPVQSALQLQTAGLATAANQITGIGSTNAINSTLGVPAQDPSLTTINGTLGAPAQDSIRTAIPLNISTTGVPLLANQSSLVNQASLNIGSGANNNSSTFSIKQLSFEMVIAGQNIPIGDATPYSLVVLIWSDSTSGLLVGKDSFVMILGNQIGTNIAPHVFRGPCKGDQVQVHIHNYSTTQAGLYNYTLLSNSRIVPTETLDLAVDWQQDSGALNGFAPTATAIYLDGKTIASFLNSSLGVGATDTWVSPPHNGAAWVNFFETGVAGANISIQARPMPPALYGNTPWLLSDVMVSGNPNKLEANLLLPLGPVQWQIKNNGSVAASYGGILVVE
jgi:hypothetical protein